MPNWNDNIVKIEGDDYEISRLLEMGIGGQTVDEDDNSIPFEMNNFFPTPMKEDTNEVIDGWYSWRCENWGCKWDMSDVNADRDNKELELFYQTPWGPNEIFWGRIAEQFPKLTISLSYYEGGMMFGGQMRWEEGELYTAREHTIKDNTNIDDFKMFADNMKEIGFEWAYNDIHEYVIAELEEELAEAEKENN